MNPITEATHVTPGVEMGVTSPHDGLSAEPLARRSFLGFGVGGLALGGALFRDGSGDDHGDQSHGGERRKTERIARRLFRVIETRDTAAIWSMFADDGVIEFPFLGLTITDLATLDAAIGPLLAVLDDLTYTDFVFEPLADPRGVIVKHKGHATISFNNKPYDQTYINEVRVRNGKVSLYVEYFDTDVLNKALSP